ncbi:MAG: hypothetical protein GY851_28755 [bacterium]|nr:hypothetical protein [bacterium]
MKRSWRTEARAFVQTSLESALARWLGRTGRLCDHDVVLDADGMLQPWTELDRILRDSVDFIVHCPTHPTRFGDDPWYLLTSKLNKDGSFRLNQNNQGSNAYYAVETAARYYAYSGDPTALAPARRLLDRVRMFHTPSDWAWPGVPRTQDDRPGDGAYEDEWSGVDKIAMVGAAYVRFHRLTGEQDWLDKAVRIADVLAARVEPGDADCSPLPFRVNLRTGEVLDPYTAHMVAPVILFDALMELGAGGTGTYSVARDRIWEWILAYPMTNGRWSGYYEDVATRPGNLNQQIPLETARYMMQRPGACPEFKRHVPALIEWVRARFGKTRRYGATSIREQDCCYHEMGSHTARYASVVARWHGISGDDRDRREALGSAALATYSALGRHLVNGRAVNYCGVGSVNPWFSDSYFDYLPHLMDTVAELPELAPSDSDHILGSTGTVTRVQYAPGRVEYETFEPDGEETLRLTFRPRVYVGDEVMNPTHWNFGTSRHASNVLRIQRSGVSRVRVVAED